MDVTQLQKKFGECSKIARQNIQFLEEEVVIGYISI